MTPILETRDLCRAFGALQVTQRVNLSLAAGARHALIGPNGAGKTTLVNQLTGVLRPTSGSVLIDGADVTRVPVEERVRRGLSRTFQINSLFAHLTPLEAVAADVAILLIEHDMSLVFRFAKRITVLVGGAELVTGTPAEIAADERVREVYLGKGRH